MADLLDIAPSTAVEMVQLGDDEGQSVEVRGITINAMAAIITQFPELKSIMMGTSGNPVPLVVSGCVAAIGPIIAAGVGHFGEQKYVEHAAQMLPEQQLKLLQAIVRLTFPNGIGAFMSEVTALMNGAAEGEAPRTARMRSKKSQSPSPLSAETSDSRPIMQ